MVRQTEMAFFMVIQVYGVAPPPIAAKLDRN
jgi:hypothetical protein